MLFLKQSASNTVHIGPFFDSTDHVTPKTGLTIANTDIKLAKNSSTSWVSKNSGGGTHQNQGAYSIVFDSTDTNTAGRLQLMVNVATADPVWHEFMVLPANVYDSMVLGTDNLEIDVLQINGNASAAANLSVGGRALLLGTAVTGTLTTTVFTTNLSGTVSTNDRVVGRTITFYGSASIAGEQAVITDYVGASGTITVAAMTAAPANADTFIIS